jgi:hypothetical protein
VSQQRPGPQDWAAFEDVRETERRQRQEHADFVANLKVAISLCDGILQGENSSAVKAIFSSIGGMLEHRTTELLSAREDRQAAVLQGRCQELRAIMSLVSNARQNREALANAIKEAEDRFREIERSFKPTPETKP